jgi:hypothetical protein
MNGSSVTMVARSCSDCLLRALNTPQVRKPEECTRTADPESALELQLEQLERSFGPNWKW